MVRDIPSESNYERALIPVLGGYIWKTLEVVFQDFKILV
jgi:hypothetical protein